MTTACRIDRQILALAIPAIINNITVPLLGLCDTAIAGHLGDAACIGAIAVGAMMMNVIYWLCGFLRAGTSGLTAQAYGARNPKSMRSVLRKSILIGMCIALIVIVLQEPLLSLFLIIIHPEAQVSDLASIYFTLGVWAAPAHLSIMAMSGWFIGRQNTLIPMLVSVGVNVVNILLSLMLVFVFHRGFAGIAIGTLCASWLGFLAMALCVRAALRSDRRDYAGSSGDGGEFTTGKFFSVGGDLFFRSACIMGVSMAMTAVTARLGNVTLAANAVLTQFFLFFSYFMDGFAFAGEALVGKAVGASDAALMRSSVRALMRWGVYMAASFFLIYLILGNPIVALLTDEQTVRDAVADMRLWLVLLPPITVMAFIFDGVYIGWTRTRPLLVTTLIATAAFFAISFAFSAGSMPQITLLWSAFEVYLFLRGALLLILYGIFQRN